MAVPKTHISMDVPKDLMRKLKVLKTAKGNEIMRNALKGSTRSSSSKNSLWSIFSGRWMYDSDGQTPCKSCE